MVETSARLMGPRHIGDEGTIDFHAIDRQLDQIAEPGKAGAEIVDRGRGSLRAHGFERVDLALAALDDCTLRDFDLESIRDTRTGSALLHEVFEECLADH